MNFFEFMILFEFMIFFYFVCIFSKSQRLTDQLANHDRANQRRSIERHGRRVDESAHDYGVRGRQLALQRLKR